jgi:DNA-3-methyladenine glycosylase II
VVKSAVVPEYWKVACDNLAKQDRVLKQLIAEYKDASLRSRGSAFETLLRAIVGQQISVKAAQSVWDRFESRVEVVSTESVLAHPPEVLQSCGLSRQKVVYMQDLARHFETGAINPRRFKSLGDEDLIKSLCNVRGIGRWTAEMFLIFHLRRPDVYPLQDIGLIRAVERHYLGGRKASSEEVSEIGERWRPWRTVATWYLWRSLDPFPVEY